MVEPGDAREVHGSFGLSGANEDSAIARAQSVNVAGAREISGRVLGSVAAKIVVARSDVLVPVVVPRRASMGSQNGVPNAEVFRG